ncbi:MAG: hypothetical protein GY713_07515 [Actinomycetia bacterium]|nr:hypothetical protein [Actinomycetes bacterium]
MADGQRQEIDEHLRRAIGPGEAESPISRDVARALGGFPTIGVDPGSITSRLRNLKSVGMDMHFVWDSPARVVPAERDVEVRDLFDLLQARGVPERSDRYCQAVDAASKGAVRLVNNIPLATREDFRWHFGQYQRLAESVASRGVISLREVADTAAGGVGDHDGSAPDFPGIAIGDDGNFLWFGEGRHRVAIAQWLNISPIPVSLGGVNRHWLRETVSRGSGPLEATEARLQEADLSDQDPQRDRAEQWLVSLDRIDDLPEVRPDPLGINDQVSRAMRAHRAGALDDALAIWRSSATPLDCRPT